MQLSISVTLTCSMSSQVSAVICMFNSKKDLNVQRHQRATTAENYVNAIHSNHVYRFEHTKTLDQASNKQTNKQI